MTATVGAGGLNFGTTSSGGGVRNVRLTNVTGGAIALGGGSLAGATGAAFLVGDGAGGANTGGTSAITYGGTITATGTARAVDIQDRAAGAGNITLSGTHHAFERQRQRHLPGRQRRRDDPVLGRRTAC